MALRKCLLGLAGAIAVAGVTAAEPPINPLVEGREPDPVTREYYLPEKPLGGYVSSPMMPERVNPDVWVAIAAGVLEAMLDRLTFPLGTAVMTDELPTIYQ